MKTMGFMLCAAPARCRTTFYQVELFHAAELAGIEFFDSHELDEAKERVMASVASGSADRGVVHDDAGGVLFALPAAA